MTPMPPAYEVYAVRYARHDRPARDNFLGGDPHDGARCRSTISSGRSSAAEQDLRRRHGIRRRAGAKAQARISALAGRGAQGARHRSRQQVEDVIVTHMHYDHVGNLDLFPNARLSHPGPRDGLSAPAAACAIRSLSASFEVEDVVGMVRRIFAGRVMFHDGAAEIADGISAAPHRRPYRRACNACA